MAARDKMRKAKDENASNKRQGTARAALVERNKKKKKIHFMRTRMWVSYLVSLVEKDRGRIPDNIGNRILITNNLIITKSGMTSLTHVRELSLDTPQCLESRIVEELRRNGSSAHVDFILKNESYDPNLGESGFKARIEGWERMMEADDITDYDKQVAARCLYTVDIAREGARLMKTRMFIAIRAMTGSELTAAEKIVYNFLNSIGAEYLPITSDLKNMLRYVSLVSNRVTKEIKDIKAITTSEVTRAQMLTNAGSPNDEEGLYLGNNILNCSRYFINLKDITAGRSIYCYAPAGGGKTVMALNLACSALEQKWAVCIQDIKGNEFTNFVKGTGGYIVSLRQMSAGFINTFIMHAMEANDATAEVYFKERVAFSKRQLMILSGIEDVGKLAELEELLDEFLSAVYIGLGVLPTNRATWSNTVSLTPFSIYDMFVEYFTPEMQKKYSDIAREIFIEYRMFLTKEGTKSYIFTEEFNYADILRANTLSFDFGLLEESGQQVDRTIFRLKFEYMRKLNAEFVSYKYKCGIKVLKILEESQYVASDPVIMQGYVDEITLRRAQGQTSFLIGNSISALANNSVAKPLLENITGLLIGRLGPEAKREVVRVFGLGEEEMLLDELNENSECNNAFLFINRMQNKAVTPILRVQLKPGKQYKLFTPVKTMETKIT